MGRLLFSIVACAWLFTVPASIAQPNIGVTYFQQRCAQCHAVDPARSDTSIHAPPRADLALLSPERILAAITTGIMAPNAQGLTQDQRAAIAESLAGRPLGTDAPSGVPMAGECEAKTMAFPDPSKSPMWNGWGRDLANSRFQPSEAAGMTAADIGRLQLKWAFGFPGGDTAYGQPTVVSGRVFVGNNNGHVYAIDAKTGCYYWAYTANAAVRTAISIGRVAASKSGYAAYFGDLNAFIYAVDALTGAPIWKIKVDDQPYARITGSPVLAAGKLIVPVGSLEEKAAGVATYECCRFRGKVIALDPGTGKVIWSTYTIPGPAKPTRVSSEGVQFWGPSGAAIWSSPTVDADTKTVYVTTSNSYSGPAVNSDAVIALNLITGKMLWVQQLTKDDVWQTGCLANSRAPPKNAVNCADVVGPDYDVATPVIPRTLPNGKRILLVGAKSGVVHALDPDNQGEFLWEARVGQGGTGGGVQWGMAADSEQLYASVSDPPGPDQGGITAIRYATGEKVWQTPSPYVPCMGGDAARGCVKAQWAAVTVIPGIVFSGAQNGYLRGYSTSTGAIIWEFDTRRVYETVNGVPAKGGSLNGPGPAFAEGMMFLNSGYGIGGGTSGEPGNVLLGFALGK
jgi:polyvinyl alcohol dehydrogenase (cytochrome)